MYGVHNFNLNCPMGGYLCSVLNKFLDNPLTCLNCLGYLGMKTGEETLKTSIRMAKKADLITVHSEFMKEFYHAYDPVNLPLPLETDILTPCKDKEDYIFYSARLSFEKNPYGIVDIINRANVNAKIVLYTLVKEHVPANSSSHYDDFFKLVKKNKNIELILNPTVSEMISLVQYAKFTVLPYFFAEPFGIAAANSVLCGTPLIAFPYGNVRNITHLLPNTKDEMIKLVNMDEKQYLVELGKTIIKSNGLRITHNPENAIKVWDEAYDKLGTDI